MLSSELSLGDKKVENAKFHVALRCVFTYFIGHLY